MDYISYFKKTLDNSTKKYYLCRNILKHYYYMLTKLFGFDPSKHILKNEILGGITSFLTMAYILAVNPSIFSALSGQGMDTAAVFTATVLAAVVGTLVMAFYAKLPFALAPGMGLNAFFVYTVCLTMGYSWQFALTAVFLEGIIFIILSITKVRQLIVEAIPVSLKSAIAVGIGLFIASLGFKNAGVVVADSATLIKLGDLTQGAPLLFCIGFVITGVMYAMKLRGALLWGIIITTLVGIPMGQTQLNGIVDTPPSLAPIFCKFEWSHIFTLDMFVVVLTFLFIDMFDTIGTLIGVTNSAGMMDKDGKIHNLSKALMADAVATTAGACFGTSTTTTYVESASGVAEGGRTGLTAFATACCFAVALFFAPFFLAIPSVATAPVLVLVGVAMFSSVTGINIKDWEEAIPSFLVIVLMPLTGSISDGILLGIISYVLICMCTGKLTKLNATIDILALLFILRYAFI